jgi:hypothetical protein
MKNSIVITTIALVACTNAPHAQDAPTPTSSAPSEHAQPAAAASSAPTSHGLGDLDALTFDCPKAGLNAAAREASKAPSQGTYQFSYFNIIHDAHHAFYEVHFKSNYQGEPDLKYCVSMYCQQGWDPRTTKTMVTLMSSDRKRGAHRTACGVHSPDGKRKRQR